MTESLDYLAAYLRRSHYHLDCRFCGRGEFFICPICWVRCGAEADPTAARSFAGTVFTFCRLLLGCSPTSLDTLTRLRLYGLLHRATTILDRDFRWTEPRSCGTDRRAVFPVERFDLLALARAVVDTLESLSEVKSRFAEIGADLEDSLPLSFLKSSVAESVSAFESGFAGAAERR